jgi:2-keto-3-deoxy-galactonokinase
MCFTPWVNFVQTVIDLAAGIPDGTLHIGSELTQTRQLAAHKDDIILVAAPHVQVVLEQVLDFCGEASSRH